MDRSYEYEYMDETSIPGELICSICTSPFIDPVQIQCEDTFCCQCITTWIQRGNSSCPLCRQTVSSNNIRSSTRLIRNMLNQLKVKCKLCKQITIERGNFDDHLSSVHPDHRQYQNNATQAEHNPERHIPNHSSSKISIIFFGFLTICLIFYCLLRKYVELNIVIKTTNTHEKKIMIEPIYCPNRMQYSSSQNAPFEQSNLLTIEHQRCLNYFYMSDSHIKKWTLIYRLEYFFVRIK